VSEEVEAALAAIDRAERRAGVERLAVGRRGGIAQITAGLQAARLEALEDVVAVRR